MNSDNFVLITGESNRSFSLFLHIQKTFNGVKSINVWKWLLMLPDTHVFSCSTLSQLDECWHCCPGICPRHQGKKIHWWDNLVIQYVQELCWLAVLRPDRLKQPQIITLQFADLNYILQNYNLFSGQTVYIMPCLEVYILILKYFCLYMYDCMSQSIGHYILNTVSLHLFYHVLWGSTVYLLCISTREQGYLNNLPVLYLDKSKWSIPITWLFACYFHLILWV